MLEPLIRKAIRADLSAITPLDRLEEDHRADALCWVDSGAELCRVGKPAIPPKHLVSYVIVIDGEYLLLVDHKNAKLWLPTGGHVEPGEHPREAAARELKEELSLSLAEGISSPLMVTCTETVGLTAGHTDVSLWYVVRGNRNQPVVCDEEEFAGARWFRLDELPFERGDPHMRRFVKKLGSNPSIEPTGRPTK